MVIIGASRPTASPIPAQGNALGGPVGNAIRRLKTWSLKGSSIPAQGSALGGPVGNAIRRLKTWSLKGSSIPAQGTALGGPVGNAIRRLKTWSLKGSSIPAQGTALGGPVGNAIRRLKACPIGPATDALMEQTFSLPDKFSRPKPGAMPRAGMDEPFRLPESCILHPAS